MIIPVHNERTVIDQKAENTRRLCYPGGRLEVIFVGDGCTDGTTDALNAQPAPHWKVIEIQPRGGKAGALNAGVAAAKHELLVFTDASILLAPDSLMHIVGPFADARIGCVSGEDHISQSGGEGLYGRYELALRRLESELHSIVGASGSFYAQRRSLCDPFPPGLAPDFYSVLRTVGKGFRAIAAPDATGSMAAVSDPRDEFTRKVRTVLRGITTLASCAYLLNPFRHGWFAFELLSHKVARWLVPFALVALGASSLVLANQSPFYLSVTVAQALFYTLALWAWSGRGAGSLPVKVSLYFTTVNLATLFAWVKFMKGTRQELWSPSRR